MKSLDKIDRYSELHTRLYALKESLNLLYKNQSEKSFIKKIEQMIKEIETEMRLIEEDLRS